MRRGESIASVRAISARLSVARPARLPACDSRTVSNECKREVNAAPLESLRREIQEGLNVVENWNNVNDFILYGKGGEFASNRLEDQEILMLALHLLQVSLVYVNTLMIQQVLAELVNFFSSEDLTNA